MSCYNCHQSGSPRGRREKEKGEDEFLTPTTQAIKVEICSGCQHAFYCPRDCQRNHWKRHKVMNCILPNSSLHGLFDACELYVMPVPSERCDYGIDNLHMYHRNLLAKGSS